MSEHARPFVERAALLIQDLHKDVRRDGWDTLLRIDNRTEAARAPYQFDAAHGVLHRNGCRVIPRTARAALYGRWNVRANEQIYACARCKPMADEEKREESERTDLLFGLASVIGQFAGVLKERGKDYQKSTEGQRIDAQLRGFYRTLGEREKEVLDTMLETLDVLTKKLRDVDERLRSGEDGSSD